MHFHFHNQELSFCDDHFKPDSWEVYSLSDLHKYRHVISLMEVEESLPLPPMSDDSLLLTNTHLRKVSKGRGRERFMALLFTHISTTSRCGLIFTHISKNKWVWPNLYAHFKKQVGMTKSRNCLLLHTAYFC